MAYWGAEYTDVITELQGADTNNTPDPDLYGGQTEVEEVMAQEMELITSYINDDARKILESGKVSCHKVIENCQNTAQTAVDSGQEFIGTVDQLTFRISQNVTLDNFSDGLDNTNYTFTGNVLAISTTKSRGDNFYTYYSMDPGSIEVPQLARLLIKMSAMVLMRREIIGGDGEDESTVNEAADAIATEINESLVALKESITPSKLLGINLCQPINNPDVATISRINRCT